MVNISRLLAVRHKAAIEKGVFLQDEHYLLTFDTGKEVWLTPDEGRQLLTQDGIGLAKGAEGMIATTSEALT